MSLIKVKKDGSLSSRSLIDNFFDTSALNVPSILDLAAMRSGYGLLANFPPVNITENNKEYKFELCAPGLVKKDFKIETENGMITISTEKKNETNGEGENYSKREFSYEKFCRSFDLPENSVPEKIEAKYENGILRLILPKRDTTGSKPKREIKVT